jgi:hypothetical protein
MKYYDGSVAKLGDVVLVPLHVGVREGRIVMLGDTHEHLDLDANFVSWVRNEKFFDSTWVAVQWIGENPLAHDDPKYAPVGDIIFIGLDSDVVHKEKA